MIKLDKKGTSRLLDQVNSRVLKLKEKRNPRLSAMYSWLFLDAMEYFSGNFLYFFSYKG